MGKACLGAERRRMGRRWGGLTTSGSGCLEGDVQPMYSREEPHVRLAAPHIHPPAVPLSPVTIIPPCQGSSLPAGLLYMDGVDALGRPVVVLNAGAH